MLLSFPIISSLSLPFPLLLLYPLPSSSLITFFSFSLLHSFPFSYLTLSIFPYLNSFIFPFSLVFIFYLFLYLILRLFFILILFLQLFYLAVDDMVDTAGTLCKAAEVLKEFGARRVFAFASHGVFSGTAYIPYCLPPVYLNACLPAYITSFFSYLLFTILSTPLGSFLFVCIPHFLVPSFSSIILLLDLFCSHPLHILRPLHHSSSFLSLYISTPNYSYFVSYFTPPSLSGPAPSRIANSVLTELVVLDTVPLSEESAVSQHSKFLFCSYIILI